jgi:hypothetical protein
MSLHLQMQQQLCKTCKKSGDSIVIESQGECTTCNHRTNAFKLIIVSIFVAIMCYLTWDASQKRDRMHKFADQFVLPNTNLQYFGSTKYTNYDLVNHLVWVGCTSPSIEECVKSKCLNRMLSTQANVVDFCTRLKHDCDYGDDHGCVIDEHCHAGNGFAFVAWNLVERPCKNEPDYDYEYADSIINIV